MNLQEGTDVDEDGVSKEFKLKVVKWRKSGVFGQTVSEIENTLDGQGL